MGSTPPSPFNIKPLTSEQTAQPVLTTEVAQARREHGPLGIIKSIGRGIWHLVTLNTNMKIGCAIVCFFILLAIFGPLLARYDPNALSDDSLQPPSAAHWLGTTQAGQDVFAQLMIGTRYSILWGLLTGLLVTILYVAIGITAGYAGGVIDEVLTFLINVFLVLPGIVLALIIAAYFPYKGSLTVAIAIIITGWPGHARVLRAQTLSMRNREFIEAARVSGVSTWRIIFLELLPNMLAIVAAGFVGTVLGVILAAAGLEFLGLGDIRSVSWGSMFYWAQNQSALIQGAWWWFVPPGVCIALLGAGLTFINLGIDEVADPRLRSVARRFKRREKQKSTSPA